MINPDLKVNTIKTDKVNSAQVVNLNDYQEVDNLGLDADGSSVNSGRTNYNNDNDRISHNPDGEDDGHNTRETPGYSPLMDK
ncbi:hypothetical protein H7F33_11520 [Pedobacter sp. PAMC26386]|nr:hypothetical protein H7F33_11520 [Pedobacter sp. PAMC26386]